MNLPHRRPLFERFPTLAAEVPWRPIATLPTPVSEEPDLAAALGCTQPLWVKHDERTAEPYGGNKVRKLELLIGAAERAGAERWIVYGPQGSNWVLAACIYGRLFGAQVEAVLFPRPLHEQARRNLAIDRELAARVREVPSSVLVPFAVAKARRAAGSKGIVFPPGGTSPLSTLGYVNAGLELADQVRAGELPEPGAVVVAGGTGGTAAGLWIGLRIGGLASQVVSVRVADAIVANRWVRARLISKTIALLERHGARTHLRPPRAKELRSVGGFLRPGYGRPSKSGEAARELAQRHGGLKLDSTYTAKALAGLQRWAAEHPHEGPLLFWNTYQARRLDDLVQRLEAMGR